MFKVGKKDVQKSLFDQDQQFPEYVVEILKKSWAEDFFRLVFTQINEERFSVLYSTEASRPNKAVNLLVSLLILKQQNQLSDEEVIGSLYFDYRFQYALGLESETNRERLCINTLSNFRCRLVEHELKTGENLLQQEMESLADKMAEFLSLNKEMARMDSSMIASSCKKMTRIELVYTVIRNMVRELEKTETIELPEEFASYLEKGHQNKTIYQTKSNEEGSKLDQLLNQAVSLRTFVDERNIAQNSLAYQHLIRLLQEQMVETEEGIAVPIEGKKIAPSSLQNPSDPTATYRNKNGKKHVGSVLNLVEVRDMEKEVSLIMHADVKENLHSDAQFGEDFIKQHPLADEIKTLSVDGAYYSQETIKAAEKKEIELNFSQMTGRSVDKDKIGVHCFEIDEETNTVVKCPQGHKPYKSTYNPEQERYKAKFKKRHCDPCPLQDNCPIKQQKKANHLEFTENKRRTDDIRAKQGTERHIELSNFRAGVEGVPSVLKRNYDLEQLPTRGEVRPKIWIYCSIIAQNFKNCVKHIKKKRKLAF